MFTTLIRFFCFPGIFLLHECAYVQYISLLRKRLLPRKILSAFFNSDLYLTQTQIFTLKLTPNPILTQTLILALKKVNKKWVDEYFSFHSL